MPTVSDHLWLWAHAAGSHNGSYKLPADSKIEPIDAAQYMKLRNVIMVVLGNRPAPPFEALAKSFAPIDKLAWSIVGDASSNRVDVDEVVRLAGVAPNLTAGIMDDFFLAKPDEDGRIARHTPEALAGFRDALRKAARPLDFWTTVYTHDLPLPGLAAHLEPCDAITYWTWRAADLPNLEANFAALEKVAPKKRKLLGCYMWDYGDSRPMPLAAMQHQCHLGLQWLRERRIDGMIFLASVICDLKLETVEWAREWIADVGPKEIG